MRSDGSYGQLVPAANLQRNLYPPLSHQLAPHTSAHRQRLPFCRQARRTRRGGMGLAAVAGAFPWSTGCDGRERGRERTAIYHLVRRVALGDPTERLVAPFLEVRALFSFPRKPECEHEFRKAVRPRCCQTAIKTKKALRKLVKPLKYLW